jgi:hypothetical protein
MNDDCPTCGADLGPSRYFVWHFPEEDCRALREPGDFETQEVAA